jgi:glycosyltransferase involved in cell wall biosynthesis
MPGITSDIIDHGRTGLIVPRDDPSSLAAAIVRLLGDIRLSNVLGHGARAAVVERFGMTKVAAATAAQYSELTRTAIHDN